LNPVLPIRIGCITQNASAPSIPGPKKGSAFLGPLSL
jgi:hypothetical protein